MKHKDEAQPLIKHFFSYVSTQFASHIKKFRSDNGGEFLSLQSFFKDNGVLFQHSCVYTPQQNGVVERKHRHILQVARALKFQAQLPTQFWGECALTAVHIINRLPSPVLSFKTPFERLYLKPPTYSHLRVFGCLAYATNVHVSHKFDHRAITCIFIGYPLDKKHTNCSISPPEKYSPAGKYVFTKITFLMLPSSLYFLLLIWATLQAQFLLQFMTQLPLT